MRCWRIVDDGPTLAEAARASQHGPGKRADGLAPAEDLLDPLAGLRMRWLTA